MSDGTAFFRMAQNGKHFRGPYDAVSTLRNVVSSEEGQWVGRYRREFEKTVRTEWQPGPNGDYWGGKYVTLDPPRVDKMVHQIQKLTAVLKQNDNGSFTMELDWVDYNGE